MTQWAEDFKNYWKMYIPKEHPVNKYHGGKRKGSGRPKKEPTKTIRVPVSKLEAVKKLIK